MSARWKLFEFLEKLLLVWPQGKAEYLFGVINDTHFFPPFGIPESQLHQYHRSYRNAVRSGLDFEVEMTFQDRRIPLLEGQQTDYPYSHFHSTHHKADI